MLASMPIFSIDILGVTLAPTWYGLMYSFGFVGGYWLLSRRDFLSRAELETLLVYVFFGVILGGRLGYVFFYDPGYFAAHPAEIIATWRGGMSFHGGAIGVIVAIAAYAWRHKKNFYHIADHVTSVLPIGLGLGRIGNYINGELAGYPGYTGPFAMVVDGVRRFPSPLLEAALEGIVLYVLLAMVLPRARYAGQTAGTFLLGYGVFRFMVEFVRVPDAQLGYLLGTGWLTMGQVLCVPMVLAGIYFVFFFRRYAVVSR
jgi:phosphatidylglycerol---prolipoprotein diacylglyceryl transferase